ncbi:Trichothecene 3-o-acetyltransferase [Mycena sanguinolenta]|uniref:Trichothecene 3-o-acetyltransferase n=1 Tax=Mycena sanguinolenta TaxID=230812 RepID=A0A8H6WP35_9AGAR|nr:Trichothecene 3-o-acetyltransferase [Mycena sanguinolenta]
MADSTDSWVSGLPIQNPTSLGFVTKPIDETIKLIYLAGIHNIQVFTTKPTRILGTQADMATSIPTKNLCVKPQNVATSNRGQKKANGDEIFQMSDTGHQINSVWIWLVDVFELPDTADREQVTANLVKGLERALGDHPELMGTMHCDNETKRIVIKLPEGGSAALHVKDATAAEDQIPSFAWYDEHDYPVHRLERAHLIPAEASTLLMQVAADLDTPGPVVAAFQVTFIKGGVIISIAISHQVSDGFGVDAFMTTWAAYSKAATTGEEARLDANIPPHNLFTATTKPTPDEWEALRGKYPTMKYNTAPPPLLHADFVLPVVKTRVFHFPRSKLVALKAECSAGLPAGEFISTYDSVAALWWRAMLRAKRPLLKFDDSQPTHAILAVNMRKRAGKPISSRYIGCSVGIPHSDDVTVGQALGPRAEALPLLARTIRGATNQVTPEYIDGQMKWAAVGPDLRYNELNMPWFFGQDCMSFGWRDMNPYTSHDFGFGLPSGFRWPEMGFDNFLFVLPSRASVRGKGPDEGLEVTLGMEESYFPHLEKDEELLAFCEQRGLGS